MKNSDKMSKFHIGCGIYVSPSIPYKEAAELLVKKFKERKIGSGLGKHIDDKLLVDIRGIEILIGAGARITNINNKQGEFYLHDVTYKKYTFVNVTKEPIVYTIHGNLKS